MGKLAQNKQIKRDRLVKAGLDLFLKKGQQNCRIEDIAEKAGVGKGTFYLYFENKEQMVLSLIDDFIFEINQTLDWVQESVDADMDIKELFRLQSKMLVETMLKNRQLSTFVIKEGRSVSPKANEKIEKFFNSVIEKAELTYCLAMEANLIPKSNPTVAAVCVLGGITQLYTYWLQSSNQLDMDQLVEDATEFFIRALGL